MNADGGEGLRLAKYEGAGNDFLVALDASGELRISPGLVRNLCDRRRGIGADGVIRVLGSGSDIAMELWNADGSRAEMSGNGMRCLAFAAVRAGLVEPPSFAVVTDAGVRQVTFALLDEPDVAWASVDMGAIRLGDERTPPAAGRQARAADAGNPHLVVWVDGDLADVDVVGLGRDEQSRWPAGVNVEFIAAGEVEGELRLRVWERGVGETLACGTGTCAAAAVARAWGYSGDHVIVHNPGGPLEVTLSSDEEPIAVLGGPVRHVADVVVASGLIAVPAEVFS